MWSGHFIWQVGRIGSSASLPSKQGVSAKSMNTQTTGAKLELMKHVERAVRPVVAS
jgi:hypothetical protein